MTSAPKVCQRCGLNCSGRPGIETAPGKYVCSTCLKPGEGDGSMGPVDLVESSTPKTKTKPCPACNQQVPASALRCVHCEWDMTPDATRPKPGPRPCPHCGVDRAGWDTSTCHKCGKRAAPVSNAEHRERAAREMGRREWRAPILQVLAGVVAGAMIAGITGQNDLYVGLLVSSALMIPVSGVLLLLASLAWLRIDAPVSLVFLKTAGVFGVFIPALTLASIVPIPFLPGLVLLLLYALLLKVAFEMDWLDAVIMSFMILCAWLTLGWMMS